MIEKWERVEEISILDVQQNTGFILKHTKDFSDKDTKLKPIIRYYAVKVVASWSG